MWARLFSHLFLSFCSSLKSGSQRYIETTGSFHFILILSVYRPSYVATWRAGAFGPQLLSPEDFLMVVPGTGQFQQLLRLHDTCAPVPLCVPPARGEPCSVSTEAEPSEALRKQIPGIPNSRHQLEARPGSQDSGEDGVPGLRASLTLPLAGAKVQNWPGGLVSPVHHSSYFTDFPFDFFCFFCSS